MLISKVRSEISMSWVCLGHVWGMSGACLGHIWGMSGACLGHIWGMSGACLGHIWGPLFGHSGFSDIRGFRTFWGPFRTFGVDVIGNGGWDMNSNTMMMMLETLFG